METQKATPYHPVSCDLIDTLEAYALEKKPINLKIQDTEGQVAWVHGKVQDVFTQNHAEFVKLDDGNEIRLDHILEYRRYA